jgi:hypothetical protein
MDTKKIFSILPGATVSGELKKPLTLLTDDSRKVIPGCCYVAVRGTQFDGHTAIDGAIAAGYKNSISAIIDGNVTIIIVSAVLMGAFGTDGIFHTILSPIMSLFGTAITGSIYSFGYTLIVGVISNLLLGVVCSRLMVKSISRFKFFRKAAFYGGVRNAE